MTEKLLITCIINLLFLPYLVHSQWIKQTDFDGKQFSDLHFITADTGFLAGGKFEDPDLCRTYDGGETWDTIGAEIEGPIQSICFINGTVGFITCGGMYPDNYIYKTVNQGKNWYPVFGHPLMSWNLSFPDENVGYAVPTITENALITKTTDGGETWDIINSYWTEWGGWGVVDFQFVTEDTGYLIFESGVIYKTTDGGMTLEEVYLDFNYNLNSVFFLNADTGFVAGEFKEIPFMNDTAGVILKTVNGGIEWEVDSLPGSCQDVFFLNPDTGYIAADDYLLETHNAGETWQVCEGYFMYLLNSVFGADKNTVYSVSSWGGVPGFSALYKLDFTVGINDPVIDNKRFSLYPNPAKDILTIRFTDNTDDDYRVKVYNQMGQMVLMSVIRNSRIDISSLVSGVYIIELCTQDWVGREKIFIVQ